MIRYTIAAWLFVAVVALVVVGGVVPGFSHGVTGVIGWAACALLWPRLTRTQTRIVLSLLAVGIAGVAWGTAAGRAGLIERALAQNIPLIGMLIGVSFLQLISTSRAEDSQAPDVGRYALMRTLLGVHLFGAVINFSAVAIFADRLSVRGRLSIEHAMGLSQAFIVGALWSPFYGAMAVALTAAPGASLGRLMAVGIPLTVVALLLTWTTLVSVRFGHAKTFVGYPVRFEALWVPAVLALGVLTVHELRPAWSVLAAIAAFAPLVTAVTLLFKEGPRAASSMHRLVKVRLPEMGGEMSLFLAAGVLSAGMAGIIAALDLGVPFARFGGLEASIVVTVITLLAWVGFHPVIMVSVVGPWLAPLDPDPNLLAMCFLMTWGIGLTGCPMSNTMLAMQSRYQAPFGDLLRENRWFSLKMTLVAIGVVNLYAFAVSG